MYFNRTVWLLLIVLVALLVLPVLPTMAQESTEPAPTPTQDVIDVTPVPEPAPDPDPDVPPVDDEPIATPESFFEQLIQLLMDVTYIPWAAAGVIVVTGLIKLFAANVLKTPINGTGAALLALFFQVLIWLAYAIAVHFNQAENFKSWYLAVINVAESLLPLFGAIFMGHVGYQAAKRRDVPILGFKPRAPNASDNNTSKQVRVF